MKAPRVQSMSIVDIPTSKIVDFCHRWKIVELALFGSILREDFGPAAMLMTSDFRG